MDTYTLRVGLTHTGEAQGHSVPVPLSFEMLLDISKTGIPKDIRKEFHRLLDHWLDEIQKAPDQHGSEMDAAFTVEYQGDRPDWLSVSARQAANAKNVIRVRLDEVIRLAKHNK